MADKNEIQSIEVVEKENKKLRSKILELEKKIEMYTTPPGKLCPKHNQYCGPPELLCSICCRELTHSKADGDLCWECEEND